MFAIDPSVDPTQPWPLEVGQHVRVSLLQHSLQGDQVCPLPRNFIRA